MDVLRLERDGVVGGSASVARGLLVAGALGMGAPSWLLILKGSSLDLVVVGTATGKRESNSSKRLW